MYHDTRCNYSIFDIWYLMGSLLRSAMEEVNGVRKQIVVKVCVNVQHEEHTDHARVHHFILDWFCCYSNLFDITILIEALNNSIFIKARNKKVYIARCLPCFFAHYCLIFVVNVVDWSCQSLACLVPKCMKDRKVTECEIFNHLVVPSKAIFWILKVESSFPHHFFLDINNVVIVYDTVVIFLVTLLIAIGD